VIRFVEELEPQHIVIENVKAMSQWEGYAELFRLLGQRYGYKLTAQVLDAADFGVPQSRKRLFIYGSRRRMPNQIKPTVRKHRPARMILDRKGKWPAGPLDNGRRAKNTMDRVMHGMTQVGWGTDFLTVYYGSDGAGGYQSLDRPLRTLTTLDRFGLVQWEDGLPTLRMLQVPELKRAMGLPEDFKLLHGSRRDRIRLLGNGVCPPVMQAVVEELLQGVSVARRLVLAAAE
jgi:DNA (cytosine-5)-methyltransferase 1